MPDLHRDCGVPAIRRWESVGQDLYTVIRGELGVLRIAAEFWTGTVNYLARRSATRRLTDFDLLVWLSEQSGK